jgi:phosphatidate cytidylyltransferase
MGNLAKRVATAAVLVPALLAALYLDETLWSVLVAATAAAAIAQDEYLRMALPTSPDDRAYGFRALNIIIGVGIIVICLHGSALVFPVLVLASMLLAAAVLLRTAHLADGGRHLAISLSGLVYVPLLAATWVQLKGSAFAAGPDWLTVTLCLAFFSDTVAYAFGRTMGRHKMYPAVSPKKTWEGSAGGFVGGVLATVVVGSNWLLPDLPLSHAFALGIVGSAAGQVGDLVASMLKRTFGVKDSGKLLPGHGGMLDRIDGLLFVGPVVFCYVAVVRPWLESIG